MEPKKKPKAGRKKRRKKLTLRDKIRAVLVAAVLVVLTAAASAAVYFLRPGLDAAGEEISLEVKEAAPETLPPPPPAGKVASPAPDIPASPRPPANAEAPARQPGPSAAQQAAPAQPASAAKTAPAASAQPAPVQPAPTAKPALAVPQAVPVQPAAAAAAVVERPPEEPRRRGVLVFVIDDAGNNLASLEPFLRFPGPLTIAVLPQLPHSAEAAGRIRAAGKEVILHQPMEALGGQNPGPGAVFAGMGSEEIRRIINRNLDEIWPVAGLNNHEGSRVTMDRNAMETVLGLCRERGILFLDSRTTSETAAPEAAKSLGIKIGERDIFLDNSQDRDSMIHYLNLGLQRAEQKGAAIMIGHTWSPALGSLLTELYQDLIARGYSFSTLSEFLKEGR